MTMGEIVISSVRVSYGFSKKLADCKLIYNLQEMILRLTRSRILEQLSEAPAVLLVGARQVGKFTGRRLF